MDKIALGKFGKTRGLEGWIRVHSYTKPLDGICHYQPWTLSDGTTVTVQDTQKTPDKLHVLIEKIHNIDQARKLVDQSIYIQKSELPELDSGKHYWFELEGLQVITLDGKILGHIDFICDGSQFPLISVKRDDKPDLLVPHEPSVVKSVDLKKHTMMVDWDDY